MKRMQSFINTTFLGGLLVFLPLVILFIGVKWMFDLITFYIGPFTRVLSDTVKMHELLAPLITILILLSLCFLMGLIVKTRLGNFAYNVFEKNILKKFPGYGIIKETVVQLFGSQKNLFSGVALVNLYGNETMLTAFITDTHADGSYTVFVPSAPAPTAGFVYHLPANLVHPVNYPVDQAMKTIISLGAGSKKIIEIYNK